MLSDQQIKTRQDLFLSNPIDGQVLKILVEAGKMWLKTNQEHVNSLNVFPVPDGDTGTNMVLTMQSAYEEIANSSEKNLGKMAHLVANGALMGARGNSGVILSQLWRGFARGVDDAVTLDPSGFAKAFALGRDTAYKGVVRPVEGTILTVAKDVASAADEGLSRGENVVQILERIVTAADESVQRTPSLLPVLKEAGVVDSGGMGLFYILEGMLRYINGLPLDSSITHVKPLAAMQFDNAMETIEPGQDYEVVVDFRPEVKLDLISFYETLEEMGTSIQLGEGDGFYRLHIHVPVEKIYEPINFTRSIGVVTKAAIENLIAQMEELGYEKKEQPLPLAPVEPGQIAVVAVAPGHGIARVFASLGAAAIVPGGQTMNPSTQEILNSFENLPTDKIIILPNNKNIILAAKNSAELTVKRVEVITSKTVPQGLCAMLRLIPDGDFDQIVREMYQALDEVETGEITVATRNVEIDGVEVKEGDIIALLNGKLVLSASSIDEACLGLLEKAHADHFELITLFSGADVHGVEVMRIADLIRAAYPEQEIEVQEGNQPHYHFIIGIE